MRVANLSTHPDYFKWDFITIPFASWISNKKRKYDIDNCEDETTYWVVVTPGTKTYYKVIHSCYWENYGQESAEVINEFEFTEVNKENLPEDTKRTLKFVV